MVIFDTGLGEGEGDGLTTTALPLPKNMGLPLPNIIGMPSSFLPMVTPTDLPAGDAAVTVVLLDTDFLPKVIPIPASFLDGT